MDTGEVVILSILGPIYLTILAVAGIKVVGELLHRRRLAKRSNAYHELMLATIKSHTDGSDEY